MLSLASEMMSPRILRSYFGLAARTCGGFGILLLVACSATGPESPPIESVAPGVVAPPPAPVESPAALEQPEPAAQPVPVTVTVAAVGDVMLGTDYPDDRLPGTEQPSLLAEVAPVLRAADIAFANLEGVLLDGGEPAKKCRSPSACYVFRMPTRLGEQLQAAGFDAISLANNHARDFGEAGRDSSMATLDALGIVHSGRVGDVASWEVRGLRVALIAFAPFVGSHDMLDLDGATALVASTAADHDLVIVSAHAGAEGEQAMRLPFQEEFFHGENRGDVVVFARAMVDAGADLVLGHGPHVPRALEVHRGRLIAYSLGNFCTYYGIKISGANGLAPILTVELDAEGQFLRGRLVSAIQRRPTGTVLDPNGEAGRLMGELTQLDFPAGGLFVAADGSLLLSSVPPALLLSTTTPAAQQPAPTVP